MDLSFDCLQVTTILAFSDIEFPDIEDRKSVGIREVIVVGWFSRNVNGGFPDLFQHLYCRCGDITQYEV